MLNGDELFMLKSNKIMLCYVIKNVIGSEDTLMNKAERPSNYFFQHYQYNQA